MGSHEAYKKAGRGSPRPTSVFMVGPDGFEPSTSRLSAVRSNQLSYGPVAGRNARIPYRALRDASRKLGVQPRQAPPMQASRRSVARPRSVELAEVDTLPRPEGQPPVLDGHRAGSVPRASS